MTRENMFRINLDDEVNAIDHQSLILRRESSALAEKRKELDHQFSTALTKNIKKDIWRTIIPYFIIGIGCIAGTIAFETYDPNGAFPIAATVIAAVLITVGVIWTLINRKKDKEEDENPEELSSIINDIGSNYETFNKQVKQELRVPFDAAEVEVFTTMHSKDSDKRKRFVYTNDTPAAFVEDGKLCFWYNGAVVGFPMSEIEALVKVNDPITFDSWMADDPYDGLKYAKYGITMKEANQIEEHYTMRGYYSLRFTHEGEPFELLFPIFNAEKLLALLDREIVEE